MKMTNDDCLTMFNGLQQVKQPAFAELTDFEDKDKYIFHTKFVRSVSLNKKKLGPIIESLQEAEKLSDEYKEYLEKRDELLVEYAKKDKDGAPEERTTYVGGQPRRSYNVPLLNDKTSDVSKKIKKLETANEEIIEARKKVEEEMKALLKEEIDFAPHMVPESMVPDGLQPQAMDGVMYMIEDVDTEDPPAKPKPKKEK